MNLKASTLRAWMLVALVPALVAITLLLVAGPGYRFGLWHFRVSFDLMRWGVFVGAAAMLLAVVAAGLRLRQRKPIFWVLAAFILGGVAVAFPLQLMGTAKRVPAIHDISTDLQQPPRFVKVLERRGPDSNPVDPEAAVAALQRAAYPDIAPLELAVSRDEAFGRALAAAHAMKWDVVDAAAAEGRIEATDTTPWFGFKDDIVVRVTAAGDGRSRIDVRSVSRVGRSDLGANAARIRSYLAAVRNS